MWMGARLMGRERWAGAMAGVRVRVKARVQAPARPGAVGRVHGPGQDGAVAGVGVGS